MARTCYHEDYYDKENGIKNMQKKGVLEIIPYYSWEDDLIEKGLIKVRINGVEKLIRFSDERNCYLIEVGLSNNWFPLYNHPFMPRKY